MRILCVLKGLDDWLGMLWRRWISCLFRLCRETTTKMVGFRRMFLSYKKNIMQFTLNHSYTCSTLHSTLRFSTITIIISCCRSAAMPLRLRFARSFYFIAVLFKFFPCTVSPGSQVMRGAKNYIYSLFMGQCLNAVAQHVGYVDVSRVEMRTENGIHSVGTRETSANGYAFRWAVNLAIRCELIPMRSLPKKTTIQFQQKLFFFSLTI